MRRADRLYRIVQRLRRRGVTTAAQFAEALEVSPRTVYRDIADRVASGVPVLGEASAMRCRAATTCPRSCSPRKRSRRRCSARARSGAGVILPWPAPPTTRWPGQRTRLPERLRHLVPESALFALGFHVPAQARAGLGELRAAIRDRLKIRFSYADRTAAPSSRTDLAARALLLGYALVPGRVVRAATGLPQLPSRSCMPARASGRPLSGRDRSHHRRPHESLPSGVARERGRSRGR